MLADGTGGRWEGRGRKRGALGIPRHLGPAAGMNPQFPVPRSRHRPLLHKLCRDSTNWVFSTISPLTYASPGWQAEGCGLSRHRSGERLGGVTAGGERTGSVADGRSGGQSAAVASRRSGPGRDLGGTCLHRLVSEVTTAPPLHGEGNGRPWLFRRRAGGRIKLQCGEQVLSTTLVSVPPWISQGQARARSQPAGHEGRDSIEAPKSGTQSWNDGRQPLREQPKTGPGRWNPP